MGKKSIIVDLDGTLADVRHRLHYIREEPKDWAGFFRACVNDSPYSDVIEVVKRLAISGASVYIFSGRSELVRKETVIWLDKFLDFDYALSMRQTDDHRPDWVVKKEMVGILDLTPDRVFCVIDDRNSLVRFWRQSGFTCLQTANHDF